MKTVAFCPAHITGFFKAAVDGCDAEPDRAGTLGAGFSIQDGVTTTVRVEPAPAPEFVITTGGYRSGDTGVSEFVARALLERCRRGYRAFIHHEISVPVGYGLGSSGAAALSLAFALNKALGLNLPREDVGRVAHGAEVRCRTGLGDVIASYHGGFEIRTRAGAPGVGALEKTVLDSRVVLICFSPISTRRFITEKLEAINGLGGRMVDRLIRTRDRADFQDMSMEFARHINVMTPRMESVADELRRNGIGCGVALFGETIFALVDSETEQKVLDVLRGYGDAIIIRSGVDNSGARLREPRGA